MIEEQNENELEDLYREMFESATIVNGTVRDLATEEVEGIHFGIRGALHAMMERLGDMQSKVWALKGLQLDPIGVRRDTDGMLLVEVMVKAETDSLVDRALKIPQDGISIQTNLKIG